MTRLFFGKKLWNTSGLTTWEINQSKLGLDVKPGPIFTGEYSFGRRFFKYQMNAGIVGYASQKLSLTPAAASARSSRDILTVARLRRGVEVHQHQAQARLRRPLPAAVQGAAPNLRQDPHLQHHLPRPVAVEAKAVSS